jgi:hypothetical protein
VTVPAAPIVTEPNACVVVPMPTVDAILTVAVVYPTPPSEITIEEIDPIPETTAVAAAPVLDSCLTKSILFWKAVLVSFSF